MNKFQKVLNHNNTGNLLCILMIILIGVLTIFRIQQNLYPSDFSGLDDWDNYARNALDIKENGLLIPSIKSHYVIPAGFFYNYFVSGCFILFGEDLRIIYFIQSLFLGLTIFFMYQIFRDEMSKITGLIFILTLFIFSLLDVYKYYSFRLLSENIAILTVSMFFYFLKKGLKNNEWHSYLFSSFFLGISVLTRPNIFPFAIVFLVYLMYCIFKKKITYFQFLLFSIIFCSILFLLALRNYLVSGEISFLPVDGNFRDYMIRNNHISPLHHPLQFCYFYIKKTLFCFGFLPVLKYSYTIRPHWILMWVGYFIYLFFLLINKLKLNSFLVSVHLYIILFFGVLILIAPIEAYGFRLLIPGIFFVLGYAFIGFNSLYNNWQQKFK